LEEEDEIDWKADEEILPVSLTRNSSRKNKDHQSLLSNGRIGSGPAQSIASDVSIPTSAKKERKKPVAKRKKERELPVMGFEELSNRMEKGFSKLSADDKVQLLNYMLECCLIESERFRNFRDQSFEKLSALTKEKRECIRDRKIMFLISKFSYTKINELLTLNGIDPFQYRAQYMNGAAAVVYDEVVENDNGDQDSDNEEAVRQSNISRGKKKRDQEKKGKADEFKKLELPDPDTLTEEQLARIDVTIYNFSVNKSLNLMIFSSNDEIALLIMSIV
jgi:hypothetical protein